jgi:hypothetical protein
MRWAEKLFSPEAVMGKSCPLALQSRAFNLTCALTGGTIYPILETKNDGVEIFSCHTGYRIGLQLFVSGAAAFWKTPYEGTPVYYG